MKKITTGFAAAGLALAVMAGVAMAQTTTTTPAPTQNNTGGTTTMPSGAPSTGLGGSQ